MKIAAIDPGINGAIATYDGIKLCIADIPKLKSRGRGNEVNLPRLIKICRRLIPRSVAVYIESGGPRPKEGGGSAFKSGMTHGQIRGVSAMCCPRIIIVTPQSWKRAMKLTKNKEYSRTRAIQLFPEYEHFFALKKNHDRAEAALLAYHGYWNGNHQRSHVVMDPKKDPRNRRRQRLGDKGLV